MFCVYVFEKAGFVSDRNKLLVTLDGSMSESDTDDVEDNFELMPVIAYSLEPEYGPNENPPPRQVPAHLGGDRIGNVDWFVMLGPGINCFGMSCHTLL